MDELEIFLSGLIKRPNIIQQRNQLFGLLNDCFPDKKAKVNQLIAAFDCGVVTQLLRAENNAFLKDRMISQVDDNYGYGIGKAEKIVDYWIQIIEQLKIHLENQTEFSIGNEVNNEIFLPSVANIPIQIPDDHDFPQKLVVSPNGQADFLSIGEALISAPDNATILIRPGLYKESLVITRPISIIGDGNQDSIIIESKKGTVISVQTEHVSIQGLTIRQTSRGYLYNAIDVPCGYLLLENCDVSSESSDCIAIHGVGTSCDVHKCKIHDGKTTGIHVFNHGSGLIEECDIFFNTTSGVKISEEGNPTLRNCKIHGGKSYGVLASLRGMGVIEKCNIYENKDAGLLIYEQATPIIRNCNIHHGISSGVFVLNQGLGVIEDCDINTNWGSGVVIQSQGNPILRNCRIYDGKSSGIFAFSNGLGVMEDCDLYNNTSAGVFISGQANPTLRRCKIRNGKQSGIFSINNGLGIIEDCEIFGNTGKGIETINSEEPTNIRSKIS